MAKSGMRDIKSLRHEVDMLSEKHKMTQEMLYMLRQNVDSLKTIITMQERQVPFQPIGIKTGGMIESIIEEGSDHLDTEVFLQSSQEQQATTLHSNAAKSTQKRRGSLT